MLSGTQALDRSFNGSSVFGVKGSKAGLKALSLRDDDDVEALSNLRSAENLSNQSFSSISDDGAAELFRGRNPQPTRPGRRIKAREQEQREIWPVNARPVLVDTLKLGSAPDPHVTRQSSHWPGPSGLFRADGQTFAALCASPLEYETAVFSAHTLEKAMTTLSAQCIWLESAFTLHDILALDEPTMLRAFSKGVNARAFVGHGLVARRSAGLDFIAACVS